MNSITKGEKDAIDWGFLITYKIYLKSDRIKGTLTFSGLIRVSALKKL